MQNFGVLPEAQNPVWTPVSYCSNVDIMSAGMRICASISFDVWHVTNNGGQSNKTNHSLGTFRCGGGLRGMWKRACMGCMSHKAVLGEERVGKRKGVPSQLSLTLPTSWWEQPLHLRGSPSAISIAMMPRDHWSLWGKRQGQTKSGSTPCISYYWSPSIYDNYSSTTDILNFAGHAKGKEGEHVKGLLHTAMHPKHNILLPTLCSFPSNCSTSLT